MESNTQRKRKNYGREAEEVAKYGSFVVACVDHEPFCVSNMVDRGKRCGLAR